MKIVGISRDEQFSPRMTEADAAIFEAVAARLEAHGHEVTRLPESALCFEYPHDRPQYDAATEARLAEADAFFTMARSHKVLFELERLFQLRPRPCVNTTDGIFICSDRWLLHCHMQDAGLPLPATTLAQTYLHCEGEDIPSAYDLVPQAAYPLWLKRTNGHTEVPEDVVFVESPEAAFPVLDDFFRRMHTLVALCEHVEGDLVKFYGVEGTGFFDWDYAAPTHSKFGLEAVNGAAHRYEFDASALQEGCERLAKAIGVPVYGGDAVVRSDGSFAVIDFNDWPSFSRCRERAAVAIVEKIERLKN